jgi:hypothetical protein
LTLGAQALTVSDPIELIALGEQELKLTTVTFKKWAATAYSDVTQTHWWKALNYFEAARQNLAPPPPSPTFEWFNAEAALDQEDTNHCVGFSGAQWGNTLPVNDQFDNRDGHALYYECKVIDGEPNEENGSVMRSIGSALKARKRLTAYAFAESVDVAVEWIKTKGPIMAGTNWYDDMFNPDPTGLVKVLGPEVGGHAYLWNGFDPVTDEILCINSWGRNWADEGHFRIGLQDAKTLFRFDGELLVALELPLG